MTENAANVDTEPAAEGQTVAAFDYADLAAADREFVRQVEVKVRVSLRRSVADLLEAGDMLAKAKRRLEKRFKPWLHHIELPPRSAFRLLAVHRVFGKVEPAVMERFTPTALYRLVISNVPKDLQEYCIQEVRDNPRLLMTAGKVEQLLTAFHAAPKTLSAREVRQLTAGNPDPDSGPVNPDEVFAAENWLLLDKLLAAGCTLHLSASVDDEAQDRTILGILIAAKAGERRTASHTGAQGTASLLERVVLTLAGVVRQKECPKCNIGKPLDEFSVRVDRPDGRNRYCLTCERSRVAKYEKKKRARERAERERLAKRLAA